MSVLSPKKRKAISLQTWTGPEDSRRLRLPDFKTIGTLIIIIIIIIIIMIIIIIIIIKIWKAVPGKHSIDSLQKTAILGTSHIIRKVLQCEA